MNLSPRSLGSSFWDKRIIKRKNNKHKEQVGRVMLPSIQHPYVCHQRGFPLQKYFIPGCVGRGLDLDLRTRPAPAAASGNPGYTDVAPLGLRSKNKISERHGL